MSLDISKYIKKRKSKSIVRRLKIAFKLYLRNVKQKRKKYKLEAGNELKIKESSVEQYKNNEGCFSDCMGCLIPFIVLLMLGVIIINLDAPWWAIVIIILLLIK